jgi:hypothetical protein
LWNIVIFFPWGKLNISDLKQVFRKYGSREDDEPEQDFSLKKPTNTPFKILTHVINRTLDCELQINEKNTSVIYKLKKNRVTSRSCSDVRNQKKKIFCQTSNMQNFNYIK